MADKKQIKRNIRQLQRIKTWQLVLLLIIMGLFGATFLRLNNIGMIERRTAVFNADKQGNIEQTRTRLFDLQRYASEHMNADSGVIYLSDQYERDTKKAITNASEVNPDDNINVKADQICKQRFGGYSQAYVQCFASELAKYPAATNTPDKAQLPDPATYRHSFSSPLWSPDFAGFSLVIIALLAVAIVARLVSIAVLKMMLHRHYSSI